MLSGVQRRALRFVCCNDASYSEFLQEYNAIVIKLSFAYIGVKLWTEISAVIKESTQHDFKKLVALHTRDGVWSYVNKF